MQESMVKCPKCGADFELGEAFKRDREAELSRQLEEQARKKDAEWQKKLIAKEEERQKESKNLKAKIETEAKKRAKDDVALEVQDLQEQVSEKTRLLDETRKQALELKKMKRDLEEREQSLELNASKREEVAAAKAKEQSEEKNRLKLVEKDKQLADMVHQMEDLKRKAEQGSQQAQGEVLEQDTENRLRTKFPTDDFDPVGQGTKGGDIIHSVKFADGRVAGRILWETKRTKTWADGWIQKVKEDGNASKADLCVIVTEATPKNFYQFEQRDGVWISDITSAINLAVVLRQALLQVAREKTFQAGRENQKDLIYDYLTGQEFRVESILRAFTGLKKGLEQERRAMEKHWAAQDKHIERVVKNLSGMHGDIEGLAGNGLPEIKMLELSSISESSDEEDSSDDSDAKT